MADAPISFKSLEIDAAAEAERIAEAIRDIVWVQLCRRGVVIGLSGGIDSSVAAALCVRAMGRERVLGLFMPESDSSKESLRLGKILSKSLGISTVFEDISAVLRAAGCYRHRDEAVRLVIPSFGDGWKFKIVMSDSYGSTPYAIPSVVAQAPGAKEITKRLNAQAYSKLVAATNFKQRTRKMIEYYHADLLHYAVVGTPNRLEYDQGFFVKNGDGSADLKPLAHLYKTQVYQLAAHLQIPEEIQRRPPTTDTFSLPQSQEELYFSLSLQHMDMCLFGKNHEICPEAIGNVIGMKGEQVKHVYSAIDSRRRATTYLHRAPILVECV